MKIKKRKSPYVLLFLVVIIITVGLLVNDVISLTYATTSQITDPDFTLTINNDGSLSPDPNKSLFDSSGGWYPGLSQDGVLKIKNNFRRIKVTGFKLHVDDENEMNEINKLSFLCRKDSFYLNNLTQTLELTT